MLQFANKNFVLQMEAAAITTFYSHYTGQSVLAGTTS